MSGARRWAPRGTGFIVTVSTVPTRTHRPAEAWGVCKDQTAASRQPCLVLLMNRTGASILFPQKTGSALAQFTTAPPL